MNFYPANFDIMNGFRGVFSLWWVLLVVLYNVKQPVVKTVSNITIPAVEQQSLINPGQGVLSEEFLMLGSGSNGCGYSKISAPDDYSTFWQLIKGPAFSQSITRKTYPDDSSNNFSGVSIILFPFHTFW